MHAGPIWVHISLLGLLPTRNVRAREELVITVLIDMRLDVASRENLRAPLGSERALHADIVAHINEQARDVHENSHGRGTAGWAGEVLGRAVPRSDSGVQAFLAKDMIALQANWSDERAVAYRTHQMPVVAGDIVECPKVNQLPFRLHGERFQDDGTIQERVPRGEGLVHGSLEAPLTSRRQGLMSRILS